MLGIHSWGTLRLYEQNYQPSYYVEEQRFSEGVTSFWLNGDSSVRLQVATALS